MILTDRKLFLIELKLNVSVESLDDSRWSEYYEAMNQIAEFYLFMKDKIVNLFDHCSIDNIVPYIAMRNAPCFDKRRNSQRNNERENFRDKTKMKIRHGSTLNLIEY